MHTDTDSDKDLFPDEYKTLPDRLGMQHGC